MKITLKLPGGGELHFEKKPMSEDEKYTMLAAGSLVCFLAFMLLLIWMLR